MGSKRRGILFATAQGKLKIDSKYFFQFPKIFIKNLKSFLCLITFEKDLENMPEFEEFDDYLEINGETFHKPFVGRVVKNPRTKF